MGPAGHPSPEFQLLSNYPGLPGSSSAPPGPLSSRSSSPSLSFSTATSSSHPVPSSPPSPSLPPSPFSCGSALAPFPGRFTNVVEVDARSVDGPVVEPVYVASVVQVGAAEECGPTGCGIWQPPAWEFISRGSDPDLLACDLLTSSAGCTASGCPLAPGP
ncbi:MAG: hypothetical protein METHAR1v1_640013 [Methanothrix sp.]|nr:MAG: hypothetical protein METHAR1v1_640013 [Methanothrix sp.]